MMCTAKACGRATPPPYTPTACTTTKLYHYGYTAIAHIAKNYTLYIGVYFSNINHCFSSKYEYGQ